MLGYGSKHGTNPRSTVSTPLRQQPCRRFVVPHTTTPRYRANPMARYLQRDSMTGESAVCARAPPRAHTPIAAPLGGLAWQGSSRGYLPTCTTVLVPARGLLGAPRGMPVQGGLPARLCRQPPPWGCQVWHALCNRSLEYGGGGEWHRACRGEVPPFKCGISFWKWFLGNLYVWLGLANPFKCGVFF